MRLRSVGADLLWRDSRNFPLQSHPFFVRRTTYLLATLMFITLLALPTADGFLNFAPKTLVAESDTTHLPHLTANPLSWVHWFDVVRRGYLDRHVNLRGLLITWNNYLETFVLTSTNPSSQVMAGIDHWLFLAQDGTRNSIEEARTLADLPEQGMAALAGELERRRQWLAARGIRYLVILAPNKNTVYPEKLPEALRPLRAESHMTQFVNYLRAHTALEIVDLEPVLLKEKKKHKVYYRTDSHWNAHGSSQIRR